MVTGAVGVAAYEALRKMVVKAPLRAATVSVATGFNVDAVRAVAIEETVSIFVEHHGVVRATAVGADTALAQIVRLVEQAHSPSRRRRRVDAHRRIRPGREDGG